MNNKPECCGNCNQDQEEPKEEELTIELIKKAVEFAEGFTLREPYENDTVYMGLYTMELPDGNIWILGEEFRENKMIYPHFLTRVIEGLNRNCMEYSIYIKDDYIDIQDTYDENIACIGFNAAGSEDKAKEKAILFVLGESK